MQGRIALIYFKFVLVNVLPDILSGLGNIMQSRWLRYNLNEVRVYVS